MKVFEPLGMVTLVTAPSMINPEKISFTLINLKEKEKDHFARQLHKLFPEDNITIFLCKGSSDKNWLDQAMNKSKYVVVNKTDLPIWIDEALPGNKCYEVTAEQSIEETFASINAESSN